MDTSPPHNQLLTVTETCALLSISRPTLYGLIANGRVTSIKIGRARRIPLCAIEDFIESELAQAQEVGL